MHKTFCITAVTFFSLASGNALGAEPPIYRCAQANGTLLYSDSPCERGTVVDVHPGRADPHAADRLARARAELDRAADARRLVDQATAQREAAERLRRQAEGAQSMAEPVSSEADVYYGAGYGFGPYVNGRIPRPGFHGGGRGHRGSLKARFHREGRITAVIRRPHPPR